MTWKHKIHKAPKEPSPFLPRRHDDKPISPTKLAEFEDRLRGCNVTVKDFCELTGIPRSSWYRWRKGLNKIKLDDMTYIQERIRTLEVAYKARLKTISDKSLSGAERSAKLKTLGPRALLGVDKDVDLATLAPRTNAAAATKARLRVRQQSAKALATRKENEKAKHKSKKVKAEVDARYKKKVKTRNVDEIERDKVAKRRAAEAKIEALVAEEGELDIWELLDEMDAENGT